jgi:hypothetical protein
VFIAIRSRCGRWRGGASSQENDQASGQIELWFHWRVSYPSMRMRQDFDVVGFFLFGHTQVLFESAKAIKWQSSHSYFFAASFLAHICTCSTKNKRSASFSGSSCEMMLSANALVFADAPSNSLPTGTRNSSAILSSVGNPGVTTPRSIRDSDTVSIPTASATSA